MWISSRSLPPFPLTFGDRIGLVIVVQTAILSITAVCALFLHIFINFVRNRRQATQKGQEQQQHRRPKWRFFRSAVDYYFANLLLCDLIATIGAALSVKWIGTGFIIPGPHCVAQGVMKQVGDLGAALTTLVIAFHTFSVIFFQWTPTKSNWLPISVLGVIWLLVLLAVSIPPQLKDDYFAPNPPWCWIQRQFIAEELGLEYVWFFITSFVGFTLYVPLYFSLRGNIVVRYTAEKRWPSIRFGRSALTGDKSQITNGSAIDKSQLQAARQMLAFPIAYTVVIGPMSVVRWLQFRGHLHPKSTAAAAAVAGTIFGLSGLINTSLYVLTRPVILGSLCGLRGGRNDSVPRDREKEVMEDVSQHTATRTSEGGDYADGGAATYEIGDHGARTTEDDPISPYTRQPGIQYWQTNVDTSNESPGWLVPSPVVGGRHSSASGQSEK